MRVAVGSLRSRRATPESSVSLSSLGTGAGPSGLVERLAGGPSVARPVLLRFPHPLAGRVLLPAGSARNSPGCGRSVLHGLAVTSSSRGSPPLHVFRVRPAFCLASGRGLGAGWHRCLTSRCSERRFESPLLGRSPVAVAELGALGVYSRSMQLAHDIRLSPSQIQALWHVVRGLHFRAVVR